MSAEPRPTLDELMTDPSRASSIALEERQLIVAEMAALTLALLSAPAPATTAEPTPSPEAEPDSNGGLWLTPDQAAEVANVPRRTIYGWSRRADWRSFTRRISRKVLRIEEAGYRRWLGRQR